jgi:hypothetical protein
LLELPSTVGKLINLQTLDIQESGVKKVPRAFWAIRTLRHVLAEKLPLPKSVGELKNMQTLRGMVCAHPWHNNKSPLHKMVNLRRLEISELKDHHWDTLSDAFKRVESSLFRLHLSASADSAIPITLFTRFSLRHLQLLELHGRIEMLAQEAQVPFALQNLSWLFLKSSGVHQDFINKLGTLPRLAELVLSSESFQGRELVLSSHGGTSGFGFGNLTDLVLRELSDLVECKIDPASLPKLKNIEVVNCVRMRPDLAGGERVTGPLWELEVRDDRAGSCRWRAVAPIETPRRDERGICSIIKYMCGVV